jgi:aspartyl/glutamyl-tRNA(Asn/Gln) amidotransferase C subunit
MKEINIKNLSQLANIELDKEEEKILQKDLDKIIKHIKRIQEVNVDSTPSATHLQSVNLLLREDKIKKPLSVEEVLLNTQNTKNKHFTINRIVNENDS